MKLFNMILTLLFLTSGVFASVECPIEPVSCETEYECSLLIDDDSNGFCDFSEVEEVARENIVSGDLISGKDLKSKTVLEVAEIYGIDAERYAKDLSEHYGADVSVSDSFQLLHDNAGVEPSIAKDIANGIASGTDEYEISEGDHVAGKYDFILVLIGTLVFYLSTSLLSRFKVISVINHRKIWNMVLLITFLICGILGILLIIRINYSLAFNLPFNMLYWHVETGIIMTLISFFHIIWHWKYFKNYVKLGKNKSETNKKSVSK